jgi:hypothetical protein
MSPLMRQWGQPTRHSTKHRRCFIETVTMSASSTGASSMGLDAQGADNFLAGEGPSAAVAPQHEGGAA